MPPRLSSATATFAGTVSASAVVATDSFTATKANFKRVSVLNELTINDSPTMGRPTIRFIGPYLDEAQIYLTSDDLVILADDDIILAPGGAVQINSDLNHNGVGVGFYGVAPIGRQTVAGSRSGDTVSVLGSVLAKLDALGLIDDATSA